MNSSRRLGWRTPKHEMSCYVGGCFVTIEMVLPQCSSSDTKEQTYNRFSFEIKCGAWGARGIRAGIRAVCSFSYTFFPLHFIRFPFPCPIFFLRDV